MQASFKNGVAIIPLQGSLFNSCPQAIRELMIVSPHTGTSRSHLFLTEIPAVLSSMGNNTDWVINPWARWNIAKENSEITYPSFFDQPLKRVFLPPDPSKIDIYAPRSWVDTPQNIAGCQGLDSNFGTPCYSVDCISSDNNFYYKSIGMLCPPEKLYVRIPHRK